MGSFLRRGLQEEFRHIRSKMQVPAEMRSLHNITTDCNYCNYGSLSLYANWIYWAGTYYFHWPWPSRWQRLSVPVQCEWRCSWNRDGACRSIWWTAHWGPRPLHLQYAHISIKEDHKSCSPHNLYKYGHLHSSWTEGWTKMATRRKIPTDLSIMICSYSCNKNEQRGSHLFSQITKTNWKYMGWMKECVVATSFFFFSFGTMCERHYTHRDHEKCFFVEWTLINVNSLIYSIIVWTSTPQLKNWSVFLRKSL